MAALGLAVLAVSAGLARGLWPAPLPVLPTVVRSETGVSVTNLGTLLSEADLLGMPQMGPSVNVEGFATWFLSEFFTVSEPGRRNATAEGMMAPGLLAGVPLPDFRSFVDSVHILTVDETGNGTYAVEAVLRLLEDPDGSGFRRVGPIAVRFELEVGQGGVAASLPSPIPVPNGADTASSQFASLPPGVRDHALEMASAFGQPLPELVQGVHTSKGWEVIVVVRDAAGVGWPFAFYVDG